MTTHKVNKGEKLEDIAKKYGHRDWKTIWKAPENKGVVSRRAKPEAIQPGDLLVIPPNEKQAKETAAKLATLQQARAGNMKLRQTLESELNRIQRKVRVFDELIQGNRESTEGIVRELERNLSGMKKWADGVDVAATLAQMGTTLVKLGGLAKQSTKVGGEALKKINEEAIKEVAGLATDPLKDASIKSVATLKSRIGTGLGYVGVVADSWGKMTSPSFWANAYVHRKEGFSKAMTSEIGDDIEERIRWVTAEGAKQVKRLQEQQSAIKAQLAETQSLMRECDARIKWNEQEAGKLP